VVGLNRTGTGLPFKSELKIRSRVYTFIVPRTLINSGLLSEGKRYSLIIVEEEFK
jgi:hypothetical protein